MDNVKILKSQIDKIVMEADVIYDGDARQGAFPYKMIFMFFLGQSQALH